MPSFEEGRQRFTFDDRHWTVVKYDDHDDYVKRIAKLPETKGMDFVGLLRQGGLTLCWIEAKDFRGYRIQNKARLTAGELAVEIAQKVRDSIAGVIGAYRTSGASHVWKPFIDAMRRKDCAIRVVLWLEQDPMPGTLARRKSAAQMLNDELAKRLRWITAKVVVVSKTSGQCPPGLTVTDLPGAGQP
jgi:hypothetical protein